MSKVAAWGCAFPVLTVICLVVAFFAASTPLLPGYGTHSNLDLGLLPSIWTGAALTSILSRPPAQRNAAGYVLAFASWPVFALFGYLGYL